MDMEQTAVMKNKPAVWHKASNKHGCIRYELHLWDKTSQSSLNSIKNSACDPARYNWTVHDDMKTLPCFKLLDLIFGQLKHLIGHYNHPVWVFLFSFRRNSPALQQNALTDELLVCKHLATF